MPEFIIAAFPDAGTYEQLVDLDGTTYRLQFSYNDRDDAWFLTTRRTDGTLLRGSMRLVEDTPIGLSWITGGKWAGQMLVTSLGRADSPPGLDQLGSAFLLVYVGER